MYQHSSQPEEPARFDRRGWLRATIGIIAGSIASIVGVVVGGAIVKPGLTERRARWVPAGRVSDLAENIPTAVTVRLAREDGYYEAIEQQVVFLVKGDGGGLRALSSTCTHLGCRVSFDPASKLIKCPCHGGVFTPQGTVVGGPPPRPLPEIAARVDNGRVFVQI